MFPLGGVGVGVGVGVVGPTPLSISPIFKLELSNFKFV